MNVHELPMVIFTLFSQMSVGTFITLGVVQFVASRGADEETAERVVAPALYAIGPTLVVGLVVSMLHMNDIGHTFNVILHVGSSWLSREILFGVGFAAFGFLFALLEWFKVGSAVLRQVIAVVTALLGIGLIVAESSIYYTLAAVPAWHHWAVPFQFFASAVLLGVLAVGSALMIVTLVRARAAEAGTADDAPEAAEAVAEAPDAEAGVGPDDPEAGGGLAVQVRRRVREINAPTSEAEWALTSTLLKGIAVVGATVAVLLLAMYPIYLADLGAAGAAGQASLAVFASPWLALRLVLLAATAIVLGFFVYRMAGKVALAEAKVLVIAVLVSLVLAFTSEFIGRLLHYAAMVRVGL
ncbi:MAG: dimethyl sulfoxide reductase anchor subunit [Propionibacteriaceae bacterium]|nr:dimethyl sulfoxide reductase anchor subunit [Propionibacteriaceae bacterium]